jgi:phosphatidate cytidylyltransferase
LLWGYSEYLHAFDIHASFNYVSVILLALCCAVVSIIGDLSMSLIKRENGIKDYGKILPGHGGVLDRFDSLIFVTPLILGWVYFFPIVFY